MDEPISISATDAYAKVTRGEAIVLDVVGDAVWRSLHEVPAGALPLPPSDAAERIGALPRGKAFLAYCT
jgi:hypothetical protein